MKKPKEMPTEKRVEQYYGKSAIAETWAQAPDNLQIKEHDYIIGLHKRVRQTKMYLLHRRGADANV